MFDSSMVNEPSGFEPLIVLWNISSLRNLMIAFTAPKKLALANSMSSELFYLLFVHFQLREGCFIFAVFFFVFVFFITYALLT